MVHKGDESVRWKVREWCAPTGPVMGKVGLCVYGRRHLGFHRANLNKGRFDNLDTLSEDTTQSSPFGTSTPRNYSIRVPNE